MKRKISLFVFLPFALSVISGCVPLLIGAGIAGGVIFGRDYVSGNVDIGFDDVFSAAKAELEERGEVLDADVNDGLIRGKIKKDWITIKVVSLTSSATRVKVSARKEYAIANIALAEDVFTSIISNLPRN